MADKDERNIYFVRVLERQPEIESREILKLKQLWKNSYRILLRLL
jgi:hypothetical protein